MMIDIPMLFGDATAQLTNIGLGTARLTPCLSSSRSGPLDDQVAMDNIWQHPIIK